MNFIIRAGTILDGTGKPGIMADVQVENGRISYIGSIPHLEDVPSLDATDCFVSPGFIDIHSHSDFTLLVDPRAISSITQGVTTEIVGNCGHGCAPVRDPELTSSNIYGFEPTYGLKWTSMKGYLDCLEETRPAINVGSLVPNGNLRLATAGIVDRPSTPEELSAMVRLLRESIDGGGIGYSTGLEYGIERHCSEDEVQNLARAAREGNGFYATHTRNLDGDPEGAIAEAIRTAAATGIPLQISHISVVARLASDSGRAVTRALEQVEAAIDQGVDVLFDMHTRLFGTTNLSAVLPPWSLDGGKMEIANRLKSPSIRRDLQQHPNIVAALARGDWQRIVVFDSKAMPDVSRKSIAQIAAERNADPFDAIYDILLSEIDHLHEVMVIAHVYRAEDIEPAYLHPLCMVGSDATALALDGQLAGKFFHGAYTWAAWFWNHFVQQKRLLTPAEAIHRLTSLPARRVGLKDRGTLREGAYADITVFHPDQFAERGTLFEPNQTATGIRHVLVNGIPVVRDGVVTGARSGQIIRSRYIV